ncbi:hypothetical protein H0H81_008406 [Sphagnurus paluster]|uniref:Uncharacterized protein n=1 Tax=Sphagnurus paluster TaxID=117069 RepID=A0A9P7FWE5_9AGAR|nr:hypothetical protein H0H81_008406 [Sphagnurus paluster]
MFLRSLFLSQHRKEPFDHSRPSSSHTRNRSGKRRSAYLRSVSFPNDLSFLGKLPLGFNETDMNGNKEPQKLAPEPSSPPLAIASPQPRPFVHAHTEPNLSLQEQGDFPQALVLSGLEHASAAEQTSLARVLIQGQVVLEAVKQESWNTPQPLQTSSRAHDHDLQQKNDVLVFNHSPHGGTWNLPTGFILVYVCPWNPRERPQIHKTLVFILDIIWLRHANMFDQLDQFAMSSTILVQQQIRQAFRTLAFTADLIRSRVHSHPHSNPQTPPPIHSPPATQIRTPPVFNRPLSGTSHHHRNSHPPPVVPKQLLPREFLQYLQTAAQRAYVSSRLLLYLSDLFSAARHHPQLDGTFLTARSLNDAKAIMRAGRVFGTDLTGGELLRDPHGISSYELASTEDGYDPGDSTGSFQEYQDIASGSGSVTIHVQRQTNSLLSLGAYPDTLNQEQTSEEVHDPANTLYVSEVDVARIFPRIVTHRLRVRDGAEDEVLAGAIFGATFEPQEKRPTDSKAAQYGWDNRPSLKDLLVDILAEV